MNKKEAKAKVDALLGAGVGKTAVYQLLRGKGVRFAPQELVHGLSLIHI